jgi:hypothetical protein
MQTQSFENLLGYMTPSQVSILELLEQRHPDLVWDGGKAESRPLRVSIKGVNNKSMAAINTRSKDILFTLEFRSKDYSGPNTSPTRHKNFDRVYSIDSSSCIDEVSDIISIIKTHYK